jgi:hypothetical protein
MKTKEEIEEELKNRKIALELLKRDIDYNGYDGVSWGTKELYRDIAMIINTLEWVLSEYNAKRNI